MGLSNIGNLVASQGAVDTYNGVGYVALNALPRLCGARLTCLVATISFTPWSLVAYLFTQLVADPFHHSDSSKFVVAIEQVFSILYLLLKCPSWGVGDK